MTSRNLEWKAINECAEQQESQTLPWDTPDEISHVEETIHLITILGSLEKIS